MSVKFHVLLPVRDEADILSQCLAQLLTWADAIYVFDTGSLDESWEIIQNFASKDRRVIPLRRDAVYFSEKKLRGWMFHKARPRMKQGDWFLRADVDEFHHMPPPEFVRTRMRKHETVAYHQYYDFRLTASEAKAWGVGIEGLEDRDRPIEQRRRWFTASAYSEPRLCRYRESMRWPETVSFPYNAGYLAVERLAIRHYPHRDPVQLQRRCCVRAAMMGDADNACNRHWDVNEWQEFVTADNTPGLRWWAPGTDLPQVHFTNHLAPLLKRTAQRVVHAGLLPLLDGWRPGFAEAYPSRLPAEVNERLEKELREKALW